MAVATEWKKKNDISLDLFQNSGIYEVEVCYHFMWKSLSQRQIKSEEKAAEILRENWHIQSPKSVWLLFWKC